ncbi:DNA-binding MarR family transcriptional regulator [Nitrobacteraceae bacterium AZCC 1564]
MLACIPMLGMKPTRGKDRFVEELERYLGETLHDRISVTEFHGAVNLPAFLEHTYRFYQATIAERRCVFLTAGSQALPPSDIAKHVSRVRSADDAIVIFAAATLSAHNRARLIKHRVPFVVPGNQLYIPDLAMDLREHFRASRPPHADALSPVAQAVLFSHLLRLGQPVTSPSLIAARLRYSPMSIGRAFDDLVALGLADTERVGKERHIHFKHHGRSLFEAARSYLRSPVRTAKYFKGGQIIPLFRLAGESALAKLTDLSRPKITTYAVAIGAWKTVIRDGRFTETDSYDAEIILEMWSYDPVGLSDKNTVDPLSLYTQFQSHKDERVVGAAEQLLEEILW